MDTELSGLPERDKDTVARADTDPRAVMVIKVGGVRKEQGPDTARCKTVSRNRVAKVPGEMSPNLRLFRAPNART